YSVFYGEDAGSGFTDLNVDNGFGYGLQAGADFWVNEHWGVNLDVKKLWLDVDASLNNGAIQADVDMDPWIVGAGVSYRF
ncbi:MAG: OmpW family protein, partial [Alphaproteobacteria bacterium]|nr:OmpW family protein [Alphaproteobacteria bacterium]